MAQRPNRIAQNTFELSHPPVTFDFVDATHIEITIAKKSGWSFPVHWHIQNPAACTQVTCLSGRLQIQNMRPFSNGDGSQSIPRGSTCEFRPGDHITFRSSWLYEDEDVIALFEVDPSQMVLLRNICGATLDAQLYPSLATIPYWVRLLYLVFRWSPAVQQYLASKFLWTRAQMMRSAHDFQTRHGSIDAPHMWRITHPFNWNFSPQWTFNVLWWSFTPISKAVRGTRYWVGRLLLGVKAEYAEYTATTTDEGVRDDVKESNERGMTTGDPGRLKDD